jgi:hypothetical protein
MRCALLVMAVAGALSLPAQARIPALQPELSGVPDLSPEHVALFAWYVDHMTSDIAMNDADQARFDSLYYTIGETRDSPCQIIGMECSWYCGGGPDSLWASSVLPSQGSYGYIARNAHDLDYCTAWSEGVPGPGLGESLTYRFAPDSPRLHTILVSNGLVTSEAGWRANNRVKRMQVAENGVPVVTLDLADSMADQTFTLPKVYGQRADGQPLLLTFTILEVYPGDQFDDTVITELWFDGIDSH